MRDPTICFYLLIVLAGILGNAIACEYPYPPYIEGKMEPQRIGWPLTQDERNYVLKPEHKCQPGRESNKHLPSL